MSFGRSPEAAFSFVEVIVAVAVLGILAGSSIWTLTQMNHYASVTRLYTGAENAAQNRIDQILAEGPFNPQAIPAEVPPVLALGTSAPTTVQIYSEPNPVGGPRVITGQLVSTVTKSNAVGSNGVDLNLYSATVSVTYAYRSKNYQVRLNAIRASDL